MTWEDIKGWYDFGSAYEEVVAHFPGGTLVEVGCYLGRSLCHLGQLVKASGKPFRVVGVDHCLGSGVEVQATASGDYHAAALAEGGGTFAGQLHRNIVACGLEDVVDLIVAPSDRAAAFFPSASVQLVFLDARHDYAGLSADISVWGAKVAPGGWLGGDDYGLWDEAAPVWPDVRRAVWDHFGSRAGPWSHDSWRVKV